MRPWVLLFAACCAVTCSAGLLWEQSAFDPNFGSADWELTDYGYAGHSV